MIKKSLLLILFLLPFFAFSQTDSSSLSYYFDDGGISTNPILKVGVISMIHGDAEVLLEIGKKQLRFEAGVGLILPYYNHDLLALLFSDKRGISNTHYGYSTRLHLKFHNYNYQKLYSGFTYFRRAYYKLTVSDFFFTQGYQWTSGKRFVFDAALGIGLRFQDVRGSQSMFDPSDKMTPIVPILFRVGYIL